jgi:hypothetical protein
MAGSRINPAVVPHLRNGLDAIRTATVHETKGKEQIDKPAGVPGNRSPYRARHIGRAGEKGERSRDCGEIVDRELPDFSCYG